MTSSDWQQLHNPEANDLDPNEGKFRWNGKFEPNPKLTGTWKTVGCVNSPNGFNPAQVKDANRALFPSRIFQSGGGTDDPLFIWSGDVFMNLRKNEALKMQVETLQAAIAC